VSTGLVFLAVHSVAAVSVDVTRIARDVIRDIGHSAESGFNPDTGGVVQRFPSP
jgi:S-adenosylmethionine synthetase